jgi:serine/threonine-protein kinase ATR
MNLYTARSYVTAIRLGSKYAYQTIPRILTIWLDMGEEVEQENATGPRKSDGRKIDKRKTDPIKSAVDPFLALNDSIKQAISSTPVYKASNYP